MYKICFVKNFIQNVVVRKRNEKWILEVILLTSEDFLYVLIIQNITYSDELGHKFNTLQA